MTRSLVKGVAAVVVLLLLAAVAGMLVLLRLGEPEALTASIEKIHETEGMPVDVVQTQRADFTDYLNCDGDVTAYVRSVLRAKIAEVVEEVEVRAGESVSEGQVLVEFRTTDLEESVRAAQAAYDEAKNNYDRFVSLLEEEVISEDRLEQMKTAMESAAAALSAAQSRRGFAEVRSPIDGVVENRYVEPGEFKGLGDELLTIVDLETVEVRALVPEGDVDLLYPGKAGWVRVDPDGEWLEGKVERISPSTTDPNRFFDVHVRIANRKTPEGTWLMRPGMYADVRFVRGTVPNALAVPDKCIRFEGNTRVIYVVREGTARVPVQQAQPASPQKEDAEDSFEARMARGWAKLRSGVQGDKAGEAGGEEGDYEMVPVLRAHRLTVQEGLRREGLVQLPDADLSDGDRVVVNPADRLRDGAVVKIRKGA